MRSRRSHLDVRLGRVEMMISSKPPSRTHRSMAPNGSGPPASPWTGAPAAPSAAAKLHRASSRPSCDCSHRERAARTRTTRPLRVARPPQASAAQAPCGSRPAAPVCFSGSISTSSIVRSVGPAQQPSHFAITTATPKRGSRHDGRSQCSLRLTPALRPAGVRVLLCARRSSVAGASSATLDANWTPASRAAGRLGGSGW